MTWPNEQFLTGRDYLEAVTTLLQRARLAHPTAGVLEAADFQWWWRGQRPTDQSPQLFWFDETGQPAAAVIATDWGGEVALDPILLPDASPDFTAHVLARGVEHARSTGFDAAEIIVDAADEASRDALSALGFAAPDEKTDLGASLNVVCAWLNVADRPSVSPLSSGYRLASRAETASGPHHMASRNDDNFEARLVQTSLYRPDLDLVVFHEDQAAAFGMFWLDPNTGVGMVEPMRTEEDHQRRGLARHVLTSGVDRLAALGAERIKLCYRPANEAAKNLYLSAGFVPDNSTVTYAPA